MNSLVRIKAKELLAISADAAAQKAAPVLLADAAAGVVFKALPQRPVGGSIIYVARTLSLSSFTAVRL